jgi:hypothetical protein
MASSAYGALIVRVTGDTKPLRDDIKQGATSAGQEAAQGIGSSMNKGLSAFGGLGLAVGKSVATGLGVASTAAIGFGVSAFKAAARASEMDASLVALARANNLSADSLRLVVGAVKAQGIELGVAQSLTAQFVRSNLDLADATKLATVAQDAAVISGRNSTEVLDDLVHGITTQNTMVLRNAGIQVNATKAQDEYAKTLGKTRAELTEAEKAQATLNAVLKEGEKVAGAYELAMKEPGKVLRSFKRVVDDIKISVGEGLVQAFSPLILKTYELTKALSAALEPGGALWPLFDTIAVSVMKLVDPIAKVVTGWVKFLENLKPEQVQKLTSIMEKFGPALLVAGGALAAFTGGGVLTQIPILGGVFKSLLGPILKLGPALLALPPPVLAIVAAVGLLLAASPKLRGAFLDLAKGLITALRPAFDAIVAGVKQALPPIMDLVRIVGDNLAPIIQQLIPVLAPLGQLLGVVIATAFKQLATNAAAVAPVLAVLLQVVGFLLKVVLFVLVPIVQFAAGLLSAAVAASSVVNPLAILSKILTTVGNAIASVVRWIFGGSPGLIPAFSALAGVLGPVIALLGVVGGAFRALASTIA